ncbi:MAG TPA: hypothetical protein VMF65_10820 [Acidimicrobiales bacterium]|nr:hypothetical protein [Acidimicrobiales bacterium]
MHQQRSENVTDYKQVGSVPGTSPAPEAVAGPRRRRRARRGGALLLAAAAGTGTAAVLAALAVPAGASGSPNPWEGAQVGLTYPVYQPKTVLGLPLSSFKLISCGPGQDDSVFALYGKAYTPPSNYGKLTGFSIGEGYPYICANPGTAKSVGTWTVGIPNGSVKVRVSVYCDPAQFKSCTTATGLKNGYVLEWAQPYRFGTTPKKQTQMFMDTSRLTLPQALHVVAGVRSL